MERKINVLLLAAGILMILISVLNYFMNEDYVSLGIFIFLGIGFILLSLKDKYESVLSKRINKFAMTFFFIAIVIFIYWVTVSKFGLS